jgi:hypothetical protein
MPHHVTGVTAFCGSIRWIHDGRVVVGVVRIVHRVVDRDPVACHRDSGEGSSGSRYNQ